MISVDLYEETVQTRKDINLHNIPIFEINKQIKSKYEIIIDDLSNIAKQFSVFEITTEKNLELFFKEIIIKLALSSKITRDLSDFLNKKIMISSKKESNFCQMIKSTNDKSNILNAELIKITNRYENIGDLYKKVNDNRSESDEAESIVKFSKLVNDEQWKIRVYKVTIEALKIISNKLEKLLGNLVEFSNKASSNTTIVDDLVVKFSNIKNTFEFLKVKEINIDGISNRNMDDPKLLRNEILNVKEFEERYDILKKSSEINSLSPKSKNEFISLSQIQQDYVNGKLNGQTIEVKRLNNTETYYYVKFPESSNMDVSKNEVLTYAKDINSFLEKLQDQQKDYLSLFKEYEEFYLKYVKKIDMEISILEKKANLRKDIELVDGCGENQTLQLLNKGIEYMKLCNLTGVCLVGHKKRVFHIQSEEEQFWTEIVESNTYRVYLGLEKGGVMMRKWDMGKNIKVIIRI
jgi:hypothetical protein